MIKLSMKKGPISSEMNHFIVLTNNSGLNDLIKTSLEKRETDLNFSGIKALDSATPVSSKISLIVSYKFLT